MGQNLLDTNFGKLTIKGGLRQESLDTEIVGGLTKF